MTNLDINKIDSASKDIFIKPLGINNISKQSKTPENTKDSKNKVPESVAKKNITQGIYDNVDFSSAIKSVNDLVQSFNNKVAFSVDEESKQRIIKVFDRDTGDIIRQIPKEDMVRFLVKLKEIQGIIFHKKA